MAFTTIAVSSEYLRTEKVFPHKKYSQDLSFLKQNQFPPILAYFFPLCIPSTMQWLDGAIFLYLSAVVRRCCMGRRVCSTLPISLNPKEEENFFSFLLLQSEIIHLKWPTNVHFPQKDEKPFRKCLKNFFGGP